MLNKLTRQRYQREIIKERNERGGKKGIKYNECVWARV